MGAKGEATAALFLKNQGYQILDTNVCFGVYELDIVALDVELQEIVFVEVKTRSQNFFESAAKSVNYKKLAALRHAAFSYLAERQLKNSFRFDLVLVTPGQIEHYPNLTN